MNFINVDPATYYEAAKIVNQAASAFFTTYAQQLKGLESTNAMAGSAGPGKDWAISYDQQARDTNNLVTALTMLADRYTSALNQIGHVYALGDHDPTTGTPPPAKPPNPPLAFSSCPIPPPSAGGPGSGLVDDGLDLARKIGIDLPVPDGDTDKLHTAATVWKTLAHAPEITNFPAELERAAALFQTVTAPDVDTIDDDLRAMKTAAQDLIAIFTDLANECAHQEGAHDKMRVDLQDVLGWFAEELRDYALVTAAFAVAASFLSFGVGGAAVTAVRAGKAVDLVNDTIAKLRHIVTVAGLRKAVTLSRNTTDTRTKLERIHDAIETAEDTVEASGSQPLGPGVKTGPGIPLETNPKQIEAKFKHAPDFGVTTPRGKEGFQTFDDAVTKHVEDPETLHIDGTYHGNPAILNYNPNSGLVVVQSPSGEFVSGWKLSEGQKQNVLDRGKLGGG